MTKTDIIRAAFRVWGRRLYQSTSLTELAQDLRVTKPALYRHFRHKDALEQTMRDTFFDDYAAFLKPYYDRALLSDSKRDALFIMLRAIVDYFARNGEMFLFSLMQVYGGFECGERYAPLRSRGIDMTALKGCFENERGAEPEMIQPVIGTTMFWLARFHYNGPYRGDADACLTCANITPRSDIDAQSVRNLILFIEEKVAYGLGFDKKPVEELDYERLEALSEAALAQNGGALLARDGSDEGRLLKAVAGAVAEAGPWNASMDMVARRAGMSKSGLYAHFKSRQDMMARLFITEFDRIVDYVEAVMLSAQSPEEKLYLAIISIANYLRASPEILITLDWFRMRNIETGITIPLRIYRIFADFRFSGNDLARALFDEDTEQFCVPQWILSLIVNTLVRQPEGTRIDGARFPDVPNERIRELLRFITCGIGGYQP
jgi:AcrR family transcriptional regulator